MGKDSKRPRDLPKEQLGTRPGRQHEMGLQPSIEHPGHTGSGN
jgi:hypothetical protein